MDGKSMEQQEFSLTLKYLLDNPALLQPPDSNNNEKCKDDKTLENQQTDLTSAYLGPQIWSDMLLSDDLKLEPVDLDELLDTTGLEDEMGDLSSLMASPPRPSPPEMQRRSTDEPSQLSYQDMPSLMSAHRSPDAKQVPSPSVYFHYPTPPRLEAEQKEQQMCPTVPPPPHPQLNVNRNQKLAEIQLYEQQFAIFNDILSNNQFEASTLSIQQQQQQHIPSTPTTSEFTITSDYPQAPQNAQMPRCQTQQSMNVTFLPTASSQSVSSNSVEKKTADGKSKSSNYPASTSPLGPIEIRIPSPKKVDYIPNTTDVIISTPQDASNDAQFDPCTRAFTEEELKPQPIIRKSKKVHVPADNKDGKYWSRRNKNNIAAKRSREARRIKENQIAMRAHYLEQENAALKTEIAELRKELTKVVEVVKKYEKRISIAQP